MTKMPLSARRFAHGICISSAVAVLILVLISGGTANAANWSGSVKITSIQASNVNSPGIWLTFSAPPYPSHTCSQKSGEYRLGGGNQEIVNHMASIATSALVNSRNVTVFWVGCDAGGNNGYPILLGVTIK
jgi:hypothetical protein